VLLALHIALIFKNLHLLRLFGDKHGHWLAFQLHLVRLAKCFVVTFLFILGSHGFLLISMLAFLSPLCLALGVCVQMEVVNETLLVPVIPLRIGVREPRRVELRSAHRITHSIYLLRIK